MSIQEVSVLAIGSGPILLSLAESWIDDPDSSLNIHDAAVGGDMDWRPVVQPYSLILYVSQNGDLTELRTIQHACMAEKRMMLPAVIIKGIGLAGPLLLPDGGGHWDSAWRRIHSTVFSEDPPESISTTATAMLSDLLVHEGLKAARGEKELACRDQCFILNPVTLTGSWHKAPPHPLVSGYEAIYPVENIQLTLETSHVPAGPNEWFSSFTRLTSAFTGIFHVWEEADLIQLPLAQCLVQPVDPLSEGPAHLMPVIVRSGLTHEEARRESGLTGLEAYAARLMPELFPGLRSEQHKRIGIGAGCTAAEAVGRGLRTCLTNELGKRSLSYGQSVTHLICTQIEDVRCRFYLQALSIMDREPLIAAGDQLFGFPVVWVYVDSSWYGSVDISFTLALRQSLQKALTKTDRVESFTPARNGHEPQNITISNCDPTTYASIVLSAVQTLNQNNKRLEVLDMRSESFLGDVPFIIYGVLIGEEESP